MGLYLLSISIMAFLYVPAVEADLYRLIESMQNYASLSSGDFIAALSDTPVSMVYFRLIGMTGLTGLLAGVTSLIVFGNIFYIIYDYSKKLYASNKVNALTLFMIMSSGLYMSAISGIRNMLAFSILTRCFYDEICNDKKLWKNIVWYLLACLIHPAAVGVVIIRLIVLIQDKVSKGKIRSLITTIISLTLGVLMLFYVGGTVYLVSAVEKLTSYADGAGYTYFWDNVMTLLTLLFIVLNYRLFSSYHYLHKNNKLNSLIKLSYIFTVFSMLFFFDHTIFVRFTHFNFLIMIPVIMSNFSYIINATKKTTIKLRFSHRLIFYIPFIIFIISISRGSLSSLKFFVLG